MLLQLREHIRREGVVSLEHLARVFHTDVSVLKVMLQNLIDKGMVEPIDDTVCQKNCRRCLGG